MRQKFNLLSLIAFFGLFAFSFTHFVAPVKADTGGVINFEGLGEGNIVDRVWVGNGITAAGSIAGSVTIYGETADFPSGNAAMIYDSRCIPGGSPADCTGGDTDLHAPAFGNTLILTEDGDDTDPDDAAAGGNFTFDFSEFGTGSVNIQAMAFLDIEEILGTVTLYIDGEPTTFDIPTTADGGSQSFTVDADGNIVRVESELSGSIRSLFIIAPAVDRMVVHLSSSGALDNIFFSVPDDSDAPLFFDGRLNNYDAYAPIIPYLTDDGQEGTGLALYKMDENNDGIFVLHVTPEMFEAVGECPETNTLVAANEDAQVWVYRLSSCEIQINALTPEGKTYTLILKELTLNTQYRSFEEWIR